MSDLSVLIVEDDKDMAKTIQLLLKSKFGFETDTEENCSEAREQLLSNEFDIIILDYQLPDGNGLELLDEIVADESHPPAIMVTGRGDEDIATQAFQKGAFDYIKKGPKLSSKLSEVVQRVIDSIELQKALRESEERYRLAFENASDIIYTLNQDLIITEISPSVEKVLGYTPEELIGKRFPELGVLSPESLDTAITNAKRILSGGSDVLKKYTFIAKDGSEKIIEIKGSTLIRDGEIIGVVSVARDVTERRKTELALAKVKCLYGLVEITEKPDITFDEILHETVNILTPAWKYPDIASAMILFRGEEYETDIFDRSEWVMSSDITVNEKVVGSVNVYYGEKMPTLDEGPFSEEERGLIDKQAERLGDEVERTDELHEKAERHRVIAENITDTMWLMDMNMKTTWISPSVTKLRGFTLEELQELPLEKHFTQESAKTALALIAEVMTPENLADKNKHLSARVELEFYKKDGSTFWADVEMDLLRDSKGTPTGILGVGRDVTDRKVWENKLQEAEKKYRGLVENLQEGIWAIDADSYTTYVNDRMGEMLGYNAEEMLGKHLFDFMDEEGKKLAEYNLERRRQGISEQHDFEFRKKDGTKVIATLETSPILDDGNCTGTLAGVIDITARKKAEEQIKKHAEELSGIVTVAAHELRHPATILKGYSEILLNSEGNLEKEVVVEALEGISKASDRLVEIATKLQDTSEIKDGIKLHRRSTDPALLVKEAIGLLDAKNCQLDFPDNLLPVYVDSDKMTQVFLALLENAIKFSPEESTINLSIKQNKEETVFYVSDRGEGIPEESLELVFDKFYQVDGAIHHSKYGMGFGLYIVKSIIEAHGGWIKAGTREGRGSILTFGIPAKKELVVLIVDDDPDIVQLISRQVTSKGHKTLSAFGGEEGVKVAREELPDVILLDLIMPKFDGFAVLKALKVYEETKDIPVIAVTAKADEKSAKEVLELGAVECVTKPYDFAEILKLIESVT